MRGAVIAAWLDARSKPLRALAAMAAMIAAVIAVVMVDAAGILSRRANDEYLVRTYGRTATLSIYQPENVQVNPAGAAENAARLLSALQANGIELVSTSVNLQLAVVRNGHPYFTNGKWVSSTYPRVSVLEMVAGRFPADTARSDTLHAVISREFARELGFEPGDAVGATMRYIVTGDSTVDIRTAPTQPLVIDAVAEPSAVSLDGGVLLVSDLDRTDVLGRFFRRSWLVHVNPVDVDLVTETVSAIRAGNDNQPVYAVNRVDNAELVAPLLDQQRVTADAVTLVALAISGLGILGVGLASVRERARDFGLRRALGASKNRIFAGVLIQTLMEVLLAAAIAIPVAAIAVELFARDLVLEELPLPASTSMPVSSAVRGLIAALGVGLVAGLLPAVRAARASVVQSLRD